MSLVQHVSAVEGVDREPLDIDDDDRASRVSVQLGRRPSLQLTYDPLPFNVAGVQPLHEKHESVGAYEVSQRTRIGMYHDFRAARHTIAA